MDRSDERKNNKKESQCQGIISLLKSNKKTRLRNDSDQPSDWKKSKRPRGRRERSDSTPRQLHKTTTPLHNEEKQTPQMTGLFSRINKIENKNCNTKYAMARCCGKHGAWRMG
ncbi:hypothetical protein PMG11_00128 [Penicillium brasilianum]|uniref:Uncharacterized protein n=1 Tax=Penicillium brasilianum TaxID=104259 RepID=A0A0F7TD81_PENBI|nr:hypothetical protein PMG11_00128 [Penicillium brasilianum]